MDRSYHSAVPPSLCVRRVFTRRAVRRGGYNRRRTNTFSPCLSSAPPFGLSRLRHSTSSRLPNLAARAVRSSAEQLVAISSFREFRASAVSKVNCKVGNWNCIASSSNSINDHSSMHSKFNPPGLAMSDQSIDRRRRFAVVVRQETSSTAYCV